ncbi:MAG: beta-propeller domain-containing protein, partial [Anaeroplasmataceae bacterium]|nr:beta-propeller domain-containing protein [Anaeroplasmataceae bacterium]
MKLRDYQKNLKNEYQNTFKKKNPKREFHFKLRYAFLAVAGIIFAALLIQHICIYSYNKEVKKYNQVIINRVVDLDHSTELSPINTKQEYKDVVDSYKKATVLKAEKTSILAYIFTFQFARCSSNKVYSPAVPTSPGSEGFGDTLESIQTNTQIEGIDEADVAKCDGNYIYYIYNNKLYVYDVKSEKNITSAFDYGLELF